MQNRKIVRIAFLQDYKGCPEELIGILDEVVSKEYTRVAISAMIHELPMVKKISGEAVKRGLEICAFTGYMKYQEKYLAEHPDQYMQYGKSGEAKDQDNRNTSSWGCPFHQDFKSRYFEFLKELAKCPGIMEVWVNDEACLGFSRESLGCYCSSCRKAFRDEFNEEMPVLPDWGNPSWRKFLKWRFDRWNAVHAEMKKVLNMINPAIRTVFLVTPLVKLSNHETWATGVDLAGMACHIDGICTDPYYTWHQSLTANFYPHEVYLSEWCKFLAGIMPEGKSAEIVPPGFSRFSYATFTRPLGTEDGYWTSIIPPAAGIDYIAPYTYTRQKITPVQKVYERCFEFDKYFNIAMPLKFAALVHGFASEVYHHPVTAEKNETYDVTRILPCAAALRHNGTPYQYYPDRRLSESSIKEFKVAILPDVSCLSLEQSENLKAYWKSGGNLVILGECGSYDENGNAVNNDFMNDMFGIKISEKNGKVREFKMQKHHPVFDGIVTESVAYNSWMGGQSKPQFALKTPRQVSFSGNAEIVAEFDNGTPAIILKDAESGCGKMAYLAGFPSLFYVNEHYKIDRWNLAHKLFANIVEWAAGAKSELHVTNWPPEVPLNKLSPCVDAGIMSTFEFFPLKGESLYLGVITSYFKEPSEFPLALDIPPGKTLITVRELISGKNVKWTSEKNIAEIQVKTDFDTPALIYLFELK